jgi:hypothetical protein
VADGVGSGGFIGRGGGHLLGEFPESDDQLVRLHVEALAALREGFDVVAELDRVLHQVAVRPFTL